MERFSTFLQRIRPNDIGPIKIAIIDNGIDATWPEIDRRIAKGKSFYRYPNSTEFTNAYFVPSGLHGTLMASLICKICPKPELYIARMEERPTEKGLARYTIASAIEV